MKYIRTYAEIDLDALEHNVNELKRCLSGGAALCAVIKADGYGHGAVTLAKELEDKVAYFAVATVDEAVELRRAVREKPILILSYVHSDDFAAVLENDISVTVYTYKSAELLSRAAKEKNAVGRVHIALDTGMSRIGFPLTDSAADDIKRISELENIELQGVFSHYACADSADKTVCTLQTSRYKEFVKKCESLGVSFGIHHLCNSAAISELEEHFDMARMGISMYGLYPSEEVDKSKVDLIPVMAFKSHITHIKTVAAGEGVSYGHIYHTDRPRIIATVSAGYADGYPRALSNKARVLVRGQFAKIVGRVCMDQFMIDVTDIKGATVDDEVVLFGSQGGECITAEEIGSMSESFNYEVVCSVSRRIPRVYIKNGKALKTVNYLR